MKEQKPRTFRVEIEFTDYDGLRDVAMVRNLFSGLEVDTPRNHAAILEVTEVTQGKATRKAA